MARAGRLSPTSPPSASSTPLVCGPLARGPNARSRVGRDVDRAAGPGKRSGCVFELLGADRPTRRRCIVTEDLSSTYYLGDSPRGRERRRGAGPLFVRRGDRSHDGAGRRRTVQPGRPRGSRSSRAVSASTAPAAETTSSPRTWPRRPGLRVCPTLACPGGKADGRRPSAGAPGLRPHTPTPNRAATPTPSPNSAHRTVPRPSRRSAPRSALYRGTGSPADRRTRPRISGAERICTIAVDDVRNAMLVTPRNSPNA